MVLKNFKDTYFGSIPKVKSDLSDMYIIFNTKAVF